jgi:DNA polymerase-3 subunit alpha
VAFVMGITNIDPLEYDLIFERFLNPERVSLPDIDIDFDGERRDEVIEYIRSKYGEDNVAQIVTFGRMKAKLAIRDIGRVMEIKLSEVNRLAKMIPEGPKVELKDVIEKSADGQTDQLRPQAGKQHPPHVHACRRRGHRAKKTYRIHAAVQNQGRYHHPF